MSERNHIGNGSPVAYPPFEELDRYVRGDMTEAERLQMEAYLQEDPMLADVVEGLEAVKDASSVPQTVRRLQSASRQRLHHRIPKREKLPKRKSRVQARTFTQLTMSMAAGLAFLVVSVWVFREITPSHSMEATSHAPIAEAAPVPAAIPLERKTNSESEESDEKPLESQLLADAVVPAPIEEERALPLRTQNSVASGSSAANQPVAAAPKPVPQLRQEAEAAALEESKLAAASELAMAEEKLANEREIGRNAPARPEPSMVSEEKETGEFLVTDSVVVADDAGFVLADVPLDRTPELSNSVPPRRNKGSYAKDKRDPQQQSQPTKLEKRNNSYGTLPKLSQGERRKAEIMRAGVVADVLMEGIAAYEKGKYADARFKLEEALLSSPENVLGQYYMGSSYFHEGNFEDALPYLKAAAKHSEASIFEDAQWELAQTYLQLGRKRPAKNLLQQIVVQAGTYAGPAQTKLSEL